MIREDLELMLSELLEIPVYLRKGYGEPARIVKAILKTIVDALRRGEEVKIEGFGTFRLISRRSFKVRCGYSCKTKKITQNETRIVPAHRYVSFLPSRDLRFLKNGRDDSNDTGS